MYINEIGDIVRDYEEMSKIDQLIEAAKSGHITIMINGKSQDEGMVEACITSVVSYLRARRSTYVHTLMNRGFEE